MDWAKPQTTEITDVPALGHDWQETAYEWSPDGKTCTAIRVCSRDESHRETAEAEITSEITVPATCTGKGTTTYHAAFSVDWAKPQTTEITDVPALGHDWGETEYLWSNDGTLCIAMRTCRRNEDHVETVQAKIEAKVTKLPGYTTRGETTYTATFPADWAETQQLTLADIPALTGDAADYFIDVSRDAWYFEAVDFVFRNRLFGGMSENTFEPETPMTRAMLVTVLWRYEGCPGEGENIFTDVPEEEWFAAPVAWAAHNEIVNGIGDDLFAPQADVTREQMAAIFHRYANWKKIKTDQQDDLSAFPDREQVSDYAVEPMRWAVAEGLIKGSDGKLMPQDSATRAQVAAILMRFIQNIAEA